MRRLACSSSRSSRSSVGRRRVEAAAAQARRRRADAAARADGRAGRRAGIDAEPPPRWRDLEPTTAGRHVPRLLDVEQGAPPSLAPAPLDATTSTASRRRSRRWSPPIARWPHGSSRRSSVARRGRGAAERAAGALAARAGRRRRRARSSASSRRRWSSRSRAPWSATKSPACAARARRLTDAVGCTAERPGTLGISAQRRAWPAVAP